MGSWKTISLFKFQRIEAINSLSYYDEIDKLGFSICTVYDLTEHQLSSMGTQDASRLVSKVNKIFASPFNPAPASRIGMYKMNYDIANITFGQYIELAYFLQNKPGINEFDISKIHYALASISRRIFRKYTTEGHRQRAEYFLHQPAEKAIGCLKALLASMEAFNKEYKSLFGLDEDTYDKQTQQEPFNKRYGWTYSATCIAEYERITLNEAFGLPVRQALNDLAYLKEKAKYEVAERDKIMKKQKA